MQIKKYAVMSDIHGNSWALKAVLKDALERQVTDFINLGDLFYGPLEPMSTWEILKQYPIYTVAGNEDRILTKPSEEELAANQTLTYVLNDLNYEALEYLKQLPADLIVDEKLFLLHGAPGNDLYYLTEDINSGRPLLRDDDEIIEMLKGNNYPVILCGHSHIPRTVQLTTGQLIVNPGSVGWPAFTDDQPAKHKMETGSPHARYAILSEGPDGYKAEHIQIPYDHYSAAEQAKKLKREDWVNYLLTGRV